MVEAGQDRNARRSKKQVKNSADLDCTYHCYYDGQRMIETRNHSTANQISAPFSSLISSFVETTESD